MKKIFLITLISLIAISLVVIIALMPISENEESKTLSVSYREVNENIQSELWLHKISMSSALQLNGFSIEKYCNFFSDESIQNSIEYCTSTELLDSGGKYLGNVHMVGIPGVPKYMIGIIQADPQISQKEDIKIIYNTMIESLVCHCWNEKKPGGFNSVSDWIDAANNHHLEAKKITSKSVISGLSQNDLVLEITTNTEGYLWKFIIPI